MKEKENNNQNKVIIVLLILIILALIMLAFVINKLNIKNNQNNEVVEERIDYTPLNPDESISEYITDNEVLKYLDENHTIDDYTTLDVIDKEFPFKELIDINGNVITFDELTIIQFIDPSCDNLTGDFEKLLSEGTLESYKIVQIFEYYGDPSNALEIYYNRFNLDVPTYDNFHAVFLTLEETNTFNSAISPANAEQYYFIKNGKVIGSRIGPISKESTLSNLIGLFQSDEFYEFINNKETQLAISTLTNNNTSSTESETSNKTQASTYIKLDDYTNNELEDVYSIELDKDYTFGLNIDIDFSEYSFYKNEETGINGLYDNGINNTQVSSYSFKKPSNTNLLYEEENSNLYITIKISKENTSNYLTDCDGIVSMLFLKDSNGNIYTLALKNQIKVKAN